MAALRACASRARPHQDGTSFVRRMAGNHDGGLVGGDDSVWELGGDRPHRRRLVDGAKRGRERGAGLEQPSVELEPLRLVKGDRGDDLALAAVDGDELAVL